MRPLPGRSNTEDQCTSRKWQYRSRSHSLFCDQRVIIAAMA
jgi:hypothetical protein